MYLISSGVMSKFKLPNLLIFLNYFSLKILFNYLEGLLLIKQKMNTKESYSKYIYIYLGLL
jgi:hypothetical protein